MSSEDYNDLKAVTSAKEFSLDSKVFLGKVVSVTDGDTVKIAFKFH